MDGKCNYFKYKRTTFMQNNPISDTFYFEVIYLAFLLATLRVMFMVHKVATGHSKYANKKREKPVKTLICMGSGGHTREMIKLLSSMDLSKYSPREYVMATSDTTSEKIVKDFERRSELPDECKITKILRSRRVGQSFISSIFSSAFSIIYSIPIVVFNIPELILCNGPGTCVPICLIAFFMKVAFGCDIRIIFVESFCRTKTFSLTGKILQYYADNVVVQWPDLQKKLKRSEYIGPLM